MSHPRRPLFIAQLSDPHIGADWGGGDPVARLTAAVASVRRLQPAPDVVIVTGDLADHGAEHEYEQARELLGELEAPVHVLPGNHDDRRRLRRVFNLPGRGTDPVQYVVELEGVRIVMLDSTIPGRDSGSLDGGRLGWLDARLAEAPDALTVLAMHHPPLVTGVPVWDTFGLAAADRVALANVVSRHSQVDRVVAGHLHRTVSMALAHAPVLSVPSTYVQGRLDFTAEQFLLSDGPAGFAVHALLDGELVSHVQPVGED